LKETDLTVSFFLILILFNEDKPEIRRE
jgi:hypothetical protein